LDKKNVFLIIAVFLVSVIFSLAAICNGCSIELEDKEEQVGDGQSTDNTQSSLTEGQETQEQQGQGSLQEDSQAEEAVQEQDPGDQEETQNNSPYIATVAIDEVEIDTTEEYRALPSQSLNFYVQAYDDDGDGLAYGASDDLGNIAEVTKIDDNNAGFNWIAPEEPGIYRVMIDVFDTEGAEAGAVVFISVDGPAFSESNSRTILPVQDLCGFIVEDQSVRMSYDPWSFVGDSSTGKQIKGYVSFDTSGLTDLQEEDILEAVLSLDLVVVSEYDFADRVDIKALDYGEDLDLEDFAPGGTLIASYPTDVLSYEISSDALLNSLKDTIGSSKMYFQLKFGMDKKTNGDDKSDGLRIMLDTANIQIVYVER